MRTKHVWLWILLLVMGITTSCKNDDSEALSPVAALEKSSKPQKVLENGKKHTSPHKVTICIVLEQQMKTSHAPMKRKDMPA